MSISKFDREAVQPENRSRVFLKRCAMFFFMQFTMFVALMFSAPSARANDIYISQSGGGSGSSCSSALPVSFFNNSSNWGTQIVPGTTVHLCGIFTGAAGSTMLTFHGSGSAGAPITVLFESGAQLTAPYFATNGGGASGGGAISMYGQSYITVNGGTNGVIQNTANGNGLTYQQHSTMVDAFNCNNCTITNLIIQNVYVRTQNQASLGVDQTQMRGINISGSNWMVTNNTLHDCGWCLIDFYKNGDSNHTISGNNIYNMDHGVAFAANGANAFTGLVFAGNQIHDTANWDASGCPYHHDGIHTYGTTGSSMTNVSMYNNYFYGNWGTCPTGFVFIEQGSSTPSHMRTFNFYNNVGVVAANAPANTNGWFGLFSGDSGTQTFVNNTIIGANITDNTRCIGVYNNASVRFENNVMSNCGNPISAGANTNLAWDYNFYGTSCGNGGNCFEYGNYQGSFNNWKTACSCDAHGVQNSNPLLNSDGSPQTGSTLLSTGASNLASAAIGNLAGLLYDTSKGGTRTPTARVLAGAWVPGAFGGTSSSSTANPAAPTGLAAVVN